MVIAWWIKSNVERISILLINCCSIEYCHSNVLIMLTLVFIEFVSKILIELRSMHDSSRATWWTFQPKVSRNKTNLRWKKFLVFQKMELSSSNIKKLLIFSQKKAFLIFPKKEPCTFQIKLKKIKQSTPRKFLIFQEMETPKEFLIFSQYKAFLIFWKMETLKKHHSILFFSIINKTFFHCLL